MAEATGATGASGSTAADAASNPNHAAGGAAAGTGNPAGQNNGADSKPLPYEDAQRLIRERDRAD